MTVEILLIMTAAAAALVAVTSSWRAIQRHQILTASDAPSKNGADRVNLKARVEAVYEQVQTELDKVSAAAALLENPANQEQEPIAFPITGLKFVRSQPEMDVAVAISFLRDHLDSADEDEVQRMMPMLQYLEQKALERATQLHPPVTP